MKIFMMVLLMTTLTVKESEASSKRKMLYNYIDSGDIAKAQELIDDTKNTSRKKQFQEKLDYANKCITIINECQSKKSSKEDVSTCVSKLRNSCDSYYLTPQLGKKATKLRNKLIEDSSNLNKGSSLVKGACEDMTRWGYVKEPKKKTAYKAFRIKTDLSKLIGKFTSKTDCEEQRLIDSDEFSVSSKCMARYIGEDKKISLFKGSFMNKTAKKTLYFKSQKSCESKFKNGMTYTSESGSGWSREVRRLKIAPKGTKKKIRFIGKCEATAVIVCKKHENGEVFLQDIY